MVKLYQSKLLNCLCNNATFTAQSAKMQRLNTIGQCPIFNKKANSSLIFHQRNLSSVCPSAYLVSLPITGNTDKQ